MSDSRARGRPPSITHVDIAHVAYELFHEVGFEATSMPDIAERARVGRSTLFRYFPNKAAILWFRQENDTAKFERALAKPRNGDLVGDAFAAYREMYTEITELEVARTMIRILETCPPEATGKWSAYAAWGKLVVDFVARRHGARWSELSCDVVGRALWSSMWTASAGWAMSTAPSPTPFFTEAEMCVQSLGSRS